MVNKGHRNQFKFIVTYLRFNILQGFLACKCGKAGRLSCEIIWGVRKTVQTLALMVIKKSVAAVNSRVFTYTNWWRILWLNAGCVYRSRDVCFEGKKGSRDSGRFWDGCCQGDEEGIREEHVVTKALEVELSYEAAKAWRGKFQILLFFCCRILHLPRAVLKDLLNSVYLSWMMLSSCNFFYLHMDLVT